MRLRRVKLYFRRNPGPVRLELEYFYVSLSQRTARSDHPKGWTEMTFYYTLPSTERQVEERVLGHLI